VLVAVLFLMASSRRPRLRDWRWPALAAILFFAPFLILAWWVGPELPTVGGAIIGGGLFAFIVGRRGAGSDHPGPTAGEVTWAALPYLMLLVLILVTRLMPPVRETLRSIEIEWTLFGVFFGRAEPLYHPGTLLLLGFLLGGLAQGRSPAELVSAMAGAARRLAPVALALAAMLGLSRILVHSGMIETLARAAAESGGLWPFVSPFIGVLGTFVTGSATSSNILFSDFQRAAAAELSLPAAALHGAQGFGAAIGNIVCPHNIIAGAATVGLAAGREGEVMRTTVFVCILYAAGGGVVTYRMAGSGAAAS
jgi:lactate permease